MSTPPSDALHGQRDVHRTGVIACPVCARFGRQDCKEHKDTAVSALEPLMGDRPWWLDLPDEEDR